MSWVDTLILMILLTVDHDQTCHPVMHSCRLSLGAGVVGEGVLFWYRVGNGVRIGDFIFGIGRA